MKNSLKIKMTPLNFFGAHVKSSKRAQYALLPMPS